MKVDKKEKKVVGAILFAVALLLGWEWTDYRKANPPHQHCVRSFDVIVCEYIPWYKFSATDTFEDTTPRSLPSPRFSLPEPDYPLPELQASSAAGDMEAQALLAHVYERDKNYEEAIKLYLRSANQGNKKAQDYLAGLYARGRGPRGDEVIKRDYKEAYFWYVLADLPASIELRNYTAKQLTSEELASVQKRIKEWKPTLESKDSSK